MVSETDKPPELERSDATELSDWIEWCDGGKDRKSDESWSQEAETKEAQIQKLACDKVDPKCISCKEATGAARRPYKGVMRELTLTLSADLSGPHPACFGLNCCIHAGCGRG